jgi:hypothetical protein
VTFKIFSCIDEVAKQWDEILPPGHHLRSELLRAIEASEIRNVTFRYLLLFDSNGHLSALAYFQMLRFDDANYSFPATTYRLFQWLEKVAMGCGFHILICGNLLSINAPGIFLRSTTTDYRVLFQSIDELIRTLVPAPDAVLIKDLPHRADLSWLSDHGYRPWKGDLTMKLVLPENCTKIEDYVNLLRHRYSQRYRKIRRKLHPVSRRELELNEIEAYKSNLHDLYLNVVKKQPIRMIIVGDDYWARMKETLGERFRIFAYFKEQEIVGFSSNIIHRTHWEVHYIGMNYTENETHALYFNMLFDSISDCLQSGRQELELGRTARSTKAALGAQPVYFVDYVKIKNAIAGTMTSLLREKFQRFNSQPDNTPAPFKKLPQISPTVQSPHAREE